jgi:hypothetical protein
MVPTIDCWSLLKLDKEWGPGQKKLRTAFRGQGYLREALPALLTAETEEAGRFAWRVNSSTQMDSMKSNYLWLTTSACCLPCMSAYQNSAT